MKALYPGRPKLSVLIVNHNACIGLKASLTSLINSIQNIDCELLVVDNASTDPSVKMLATEFPDVRVIHNTKNLGLSIGFNQAIRLAKGEYLLMVDPNTIGNTEALNKIIAFMDIHKDAGGLSVRMIDGKGNYMRGSKHILSQSWCTFFKFTGLSKYFPRSCYSFRKNPDWVDEFETAEVDVLNSSCMLLRRSVLNKVGYFDERFSTYGQNIDLSYRIRLDGFKTYYYSHTYIIQSKGKSINKLSWEYNKRFYGAMFIFAAKYLFKSPILYINDMSEVYPAAYEVER